MINVKIKLKCLINLIFNIFFDLANLVKFILTRDFICHLSNDLTEKKFRQRGKFIYVYNQMCKCNRIQSKIIQNGQK